MSKRQDILLSVVVPLENDCDILPGFLAEIDAVARGHFANYELIFVDDGSTDGTRSLFERAKAEIASLRYFRLTRPFGFEVAIACGLEQAIGDVIIVLNPATDPPSLIPHFAEQANATAGIVIGVNTDRGRLPRSYRAAYTVYFLMCRIFLEREQVYGATHFLALTRTALNALLKIKDSFRYIRVLAMYAGFAVTPVGYAQVSRRSPPRKRPMLSLVSGAGNMIVSNSDRPLRIAALVSASMGVMGFVFILYILAVRLFWSDVEPGWATALIFDSAMFGVMFLVLAVVCQYLAEMRGEIKSRPLYVIQAELQSDVMPGGDEIRNIVTHEDRADVLGAINVR